MAKGKGETVGNLYLRLGLNYDELNQDFIAVEETLSSNIQRLNRQKTLIDLKASIDLTGVTDAAQKLKIQQEALTKQIEIQSQKVKLYESDWVAAGKANGFASQQAEKAAIALKVQQLELARLSQRLKEVQTSQSALPKQDNSLLAGYKGIKGNVAENLSNLTNSFTGITDAASSADSAISKSLEIIGNIPSPVGKAVAALAAIPLVAKGVENSLMDMAKPAIEAGDAMYVMSRGMQLSIADTAKLSTICKVTGIEITEVNSAMRRLSASLTKAGDKDNAAMQMLKRFGAEVKDSSGNIKNEIELIEEVSKALKRAEAAGQGAAFRDIVFGRFASGDVITFLEDYGDNAVAASKIVKNGLANPVLAHAIQGNINAMNAQIGQFKSALSSAFMPATEKLVPELTAQFGELTKVIANNADGIKNVSMAIGEVVGSVSSLTTEITKLAVESTKLIREPNSAVAARYKDDYTITSVEDLAEKEYARLSIGDKNRIDHDVTKNIAFLKRQKEIFEIIKENWILELSKTDEFKNVPFADLKADWLDKPLEEIQRKVQDHRKKIAKSWADFRDEVDKKININAGLDESLKRIESFSEELEHLKIDLQFGSDNYGKALAENELWYRKALDKAKEFENERNIITELNNAKRAKIERDYAEQIQKAREDSQKRTADLIKEASNIDFGLDHSPFEKQIRAIKQWEQEALASLDKYKDAIKDKNVLEQEAAAIVANALAKEREAFEREMDRIKGKTQDLREKIFEQEHSQRDIDIMRVQKQVAELKKEGIYNDDVINRWAENEYAKIAERSVGNADYIKTPRNRHGGAGGIPVIYADATEGYAGSFNPSKNFYAEIKQQTSADVANKFGVLTDSTQGLANAQEELQKSIEIFNGGEWAQSYIQSMESITDAQENFAQKVAKEGDTLAQAIRDTAAKIGNVQLVGGYQQPEEDSFINKDIAKTAADVVGTLGEGAALAGAALTPAHPAAGGALALGGSAVAFLGNMASKYFDSDDSPSPAAGTYIPQTNMPDISGALKDIQSTLSKDIQALSETTVGILQHVEQIAAREPVLNIAPTINIDLGGAYVFDDQMKNQLTDDITESVTNAITDTFNKEVRSTSYNYGN